MQVEEEGAFQRHGYVELTPFTYSREDAERTAAWLRRLGAEVILCQLDGLSEYEQFTLFVQIPETQPAPRRLQDRRTYEPVKEAR